MKWIFSWINPFWLFGYLFHLYKMGKIVKTAFLEEDSQKRILEFRKAHDIELRLNKWVGSIYTIITFEQELFKNDEMSKLFLLEKIKPISDLLSVIRLSDVVTLNLYKEYKYGVYYYLVVLTPNLYEMNWKIVLFEIVKIILFIYLLLCLIF